MKFCGSILIVVLIAAHIHCKFIFMVADHTLFIEPLSLLLCLTTPTTLEKFFLPSMEC